MTPGSMTNLETRPATCTGTWSSGPAGVRRWVSWALAIHGRWAWHALLLCLSTMTTHFVSLVTANVLGSRREKKPGCYSGRNPAIPIWKANSSFEISMRTPTVLHQAMLQMRTHAFSPWAPCRSITRLPAHRYLTREIQPPIC